MHLITLYRHTCIYWQCLHGLKDYAILAPEVFLAYFFVTLASEMQLFLDPILNSRDGTHHQV